jgi:hypothetical protein
MFQQIERGHLLRAQWKKKKIKRLYNIPAQQSVKSMDWVRQQITFSGRPGPSSCEEGSGMFNGSDERGGVSKGQNAECSMVSVE